MSTSKRTFVILAIIFGTPLLGLAIGAFGGAIHAPDDPSGLPGALGLGTGVLGVIGSMIFGPIVSAAMRNSVSQWRSLLGYIIPSVLALTYITVLSIFLPNGF